jgi:hypothetical protein
MVAAERPEPPEAKPNAKKAEPAADEPSRTPWIIVGILVLVAAGAGVAVWQITKSRSRDGQIAVPAGGVATTDDTSEPAPTTSASASAAPVYRPPPKPKSFLDDPYADIPTPATPKKAPSSAPTSAPAPTATAKNRLFGTEN